MAMAFNPGLQIVRNDLEQVPFRLQEVRSMRSPKVTGSADYKYFTHLPYQFLPLSVFNGPEGEYKEAQFGVPHNHNAHVQAILPVLLPQYRTGLASVEIAGELSELQVEKTAEEVVVRVTNLYYNAQLLERQLLFADSNLINGNRLLNNIRELHAHGM